MKYFQMQNIYLKFNCATLLLHYLSYIYGSAHSTRVGKN